MTNDPAPEGRKSSYDAVPKAIALPSPLMLRAFEHVS